MNIITKDIICNNEKLTLSNQRAVFWEREQMLIISDLHIGKTAHFRKSGIAMPSEIIERDLLRLGILLSFFNVKRLMVVGDLFHAKMNKEFSIFKDWLGAFNHIEKILVKGNHDRISAPVAIMFSDWLIANKLHIPPFDFIHDNKKIATDTFQISGHTHPGVLIKGKGGQRIKLPCYQISNQQLVLPAFSLFTGLNTSKPDGDVINYAFTEENIFELS